MTTKQIIIAAIAVLMIVSITGCGSMRVSRVPKDNNQPDGLRMQIPKQHEVIAVLDGGGSNIITKTGTVPLPADDEFYDLNYSGGLFQSTRLMVTAHGNSTIKSVSFSKTDSGAAALSNTASGISATAAAIQANQQAAAAAAAAQPPPPNALDAENAALRREILNSMLKANRDALEAGLPLPYPEL